MFALFAVMSLNPALAMATVCPGSG